MWGGGWVLRKCGFKLRWLRFKDDGSSPGDLVAPISLRFLAGVSLPMMLLAICLFAPAALAENATAEALVTGSQNSTDAAVAVQSDSSVHAVVSNAEDVSGTNSAIETTSAASIANAPDSTPDSTAGQSLPPNGSVAGGGNPDTALQKESNETEAASQTLSAVAAAPGQSTVASQEAGGSEPPAYELHLVCSAGDRGTYWDSREDYDARLLSIDYSLSNTGTGTAYNVQVTAAVANRGVTVATTLPLSLGDLVSGGQILFTLKWLVPPNVASFTTDITACADSKDDDEDGDDEGGDDDGGDDDGGDEDGDNDGGDDEDDEDGDEEDLNGDKPPGDGGQLNYPPDNNADGSPGARTSQNNLSQYSTVRSALPSTGFAGLHAALALLTIAFLACGALLALPATANGNRRRH